MSDTISYTEVDGAYLIRFEGDIRVTLCASFDAFIDSVFSKSNLTGVILDLTDARNIDSTALGMIAKIAVRSKERLCVYPTVYSHNQDINRILECMGLNSVLNIVSSVEEGETILKNQLCEMPRTDCTPEQMCEKVIEAHKELMSLSASNKEKFKELVSGLEEERIQYQAKH